MNGPHDMGGMQTFGPVLPEKNEPVFHALWEGRIMAIFTALGRLGKWNTDIGRQTREFLPPSEYLAMNYYQVRYAQVIELIAQNGLATRDEIRTGKPAKRSQKAKPTFTRDKVAAYWDAGSPKTRSDAVPPRFRAGQSVRARNIHPPIHTRLPRYARGKTGVIERDHGVFVFPDDNAQRRGENPQHVYSVRFMARELWGDQANAKDTVIISMWDNYLEPV
jgi:nitrile hydratase